MHKRLGMVPLLVGMSIAMLGGCSDDGNDTRVDPDGESVIDENLDDPEVPVTDPGGVTNQLDGNDGDREDPGNIDG